MNNLMFAAMIGGWEILLILLVVLFWLAVVGGIVFLVVWLVRRGKTPTPSTPPVQPHPKPTPSTCPRCGTALPADSPQGLCPRCVMGVGLATQTEATGEFGPHGTKVIQPPPAPADIARNFPQLEILDCLGRGGMGVVYKARQPKLNRLVALKILAPEKGADPKFAERFLREAQALARLSHPNIVTVHDFGEADGMFYLLMEYVDGATLRQMMREGRMKPETALTIVPRICEALQFAHEQGVVHRDIKPENVLLDRQGRVKIADFGIAKIVGGTGQPLSRPADTLSPSDGERGAGSLTQDQVLGTPHYMAPEQVEHPQTVDHRADIYSLGVVFYEMLTGELPLGKFQPPSKKVQVDVRLDEVVLHTLEKEPERRYQHASEVKRDVETIATTSGPPAVAGKAAIPVHIRGWRDFWPWDTANISLFLFVPVVASFILGLILMPHWGLKALWFFAVGWLVGIGFAATYTVVGHRIRRLKASLPQPTGEVAECLMFRRPFQAPGLAVLHADRLELIPIVSSPITLSLQDIVAVSEVRWFNGTRLWWKKGFVLELVNGQRVGVAVAESFARRWRSRLTRGSLPELPPAPETKDSADNEAEWKNARNWTGPKWLSVYFSKRDSRAWVPKQIPAMGWTVNLGNRRGAAWLLGIFFSIIGVLAVAVVLSMPATKERSPQSARVPGVVAPAPIDHIAFHKVPLRDAIQSLADQIGWNVVFDPELERDGIGPNGRGYLHSEVNYRWEDLTAEAALNALLKNYGLAAVADPQTRIKRITKQETGEPGQPGKPSVGFDAARAVTLFNEIEDFGHEFDAAFTSQNLAAAQTGASRLLNLLSNFNVVVKGMDLGFPPAILDDVAKVRQALDKGDWEKAGRLGQRNEEYARAFKRIGDRMVKLAEDNRPRGVKLRYKLVHGGETGSLSGLASAPAAKSSTHSWDARLLALNPRGWREAFALGQEVAALPPEDGWLALERNWSAITNKDARQQLLKAFKFANHPHLIDVVDLALADPVPEVQNWGLEYLKDVALRDFSDDFAAARTWVAQQRGQPLAQVASDSAHAAVKRLNDGDPRVVLEQLDLLRQPDMLRKYPEAVAASGLDQALERLVNSDNEKVSEAALKAAAGPPLGEAWYRRVTLPFLRPEHSVKARSDAANLLQQRGGDWAVEPLLNALTNLLTASTAERRLLFGQFAGALGGIGSPKVIPILIGVIEAENTYDTVYGIGYFGLGKLTGVNYDEKHDGAWWRQWWEKNKQRFPADVQAMEIPRFEPVKQNARPGPSKITDEFAGISAEERFAGGDTNQHYWLIHKVGGTNPPTSGYRLLLVLPGGDGGPDFRPFVQRLCQNALPDNFLVAQLIAPKWDAAQFEQLVWPTEKNRYTAAKFSTEEFVAAVVKEVQGRHNLASNGVFTLSWSSGGPAAYAASMDARCQVAGSFVAMSVFMPEQLPDLGAARGKSYYLLQSPKDFIPFRMVEAARDRLTANDARVRLQTYEGGHGWHGDVYGMIRAGIAWLEEGRLQTRNEDAAAPAKPTVSRDQIIVEDLALRMLAAIRDKEDDVLKSRSVDRIKGWRDALPEFAFEMRERFQQMTGKAFDMRVTESLVEDNFAVVKCDRAEGIPTLNGIYLVLFFTKTDEGWRNWMVRNSPPSTPLKEYLKTKPPADGKPH